MRRIFFALPLALVFVLPWQAHGAEFADVHPSDPDYAVIIEAMSRGIMTGVGSGMFEPDRAVTRAELAKIAAKANGIAITPITVAPFPDVPVSHSLAKEVAAIKAKNQWFTDNGHGNRSVLQGYPDGMFRPQGMTSFPEASKILLGAALVEPRMSSPFFVERPYNDEGRVALADFYHHAAQTNLFDRPIDWYSVHSASFVQRRDVARALAAMNAWGDAPATSFTCKRGASWDARTRTNALWSESSSSAYSDICVSSALGIGYNLYTSDAGNVQVYVFRTDDRSMLNSFWGEPVGGVHTASESRKGPCTLRTGNGVKVSFSCGETLVSYDLYTGKTAIAMP